MARYRQGRILWARLRSRSGKKELHPAAIISDNQDIVQPEAFDPRKNLGLVNAVTVIGISTEYAKYPPYVVLPHMDKGHPFTGLSRACGACIGWYDWVVLEEDVEGQTGDVPPTEMAIILSMVRDDLKKKLIRRNIELGGTMIGIHAMLSELLGDPS